MLPFISDSLDVFRMVSRYDNRRACIALYNSKMQFEYTTAMAIHGVLRTEEGRECTGRCDSMETGERKPACSGWSTVHSETSDSTHCHLFADAGSVPIKRHR